MLDDNGRFWLTITQAEGGFMLDQGGGKRPAVFPDTPGGRAKVRRAVKEWAEAITAAPAADAPAEPASPGNGEG